MALRLDAALHRLRQDVDDGEPAARASARDSRATRSAFVASSNRWQTFASRTTSCAPGSGTTAEQVPCLEREPVRQVRGGHLLPGRREHGREVQRRHLRVRVGPRRSADAPRRRPGTGVEHPAGGRQRAGGDRRGAGPQHRQARHHRRVEPLRAGRGVHLVQRPPRYGRRPPSGPSPARVRSRKSSGVPVSRNDPSARPFRRRRAPGARRAAARCAAGDVGAGGATSAAVAGPPPAPCSAPVRAAAASAAAACSA